VLLFYNGISDYGNKRFKPLLEKYKMFDQLDTELLLDEEHENLYGKANRRKRP